MPFLASIPIPYLTPFRGKVFRGAQRWLGGFALAIWKVRINASMNPIKIQTGGLTDRGLVRQENQDQYFIGELSRSISLHSTSLSIEANSNLLGGSLGHLFMVADGMGGHRAGQEASGLAIQYFLAAILNRLQWNSLISSTDDHLLVDDLREMLNEAHAEIRRQSEESEALSGMGTTFTMAYVMWPRMIVVHAGDTRCYHYQKGVLRLLTSDHTVANQMMRTGRLKSNAAERSPWSNVLVNALGAGAEGVQAEIAMINLEPDDAILLCSDGLNKHVDDLTIEKVLVEAPTVQAACEQLVQMAKDAGGSDNVTVIGAQWKLCMPDPMMRVRATSPVKERVIAELASPQRLMDSTIEYHTHYSTLEPEDRHNDTDPLPPMSHGL